MSQHHELHELFIQNNWTLGMAESMTGGRIAATITEMPGSAKYFLGSIVAYNEDVKSNILGVSKKVIEEYDVVSYQVAEAMLEGVFNTIKSEFALAITGYAGPDGGTETIPVGTVWLAVGKKDKKPEIWRVQGHGERSQIIAQSVNEILNRLYVYAKQI